MPEDIKDFIRMQILNGGQYYDSACSEAYRACQSPLVHKLRKRFKRWANQRGRLPRTNIGKPVITIDGDDRPGA
jgi:hypothetical protein